MFLIVMGVSGSGKSTIGKLLADRLGFPFYDGDDYMPPANVAKMSAGIPLNDEDRHGWLSTLAQIIQNGLSHGESGVVASSALKEKYRQMLRIDPQRVKFIYLKGEYDLILQRMNSRKDHFMKPGMLRSQFDTLEEPSGALEVKATLSPDESVQFIMEHLMEKKYALGMVGLGVMGRSLARNLERNGFPVIGFDLAPKLPPDFNLKVAASLEELTGALQTPRVIWLMVPAGAAVDSVIASLKPNLQAGDLIIDGGNSYFADTQRRARELEAAGLQFIGMGVSGGESGALWGPSLMPGGSPDAWPRVQPLLTAIAAKAEDGAPCVAWMGPGGAGHYVKMVHNGIEYGDMQLIAETYDLLHRGAGLSNAQIASTFARWNEGVLKSYLIEITASILTRIDEETGDPLVDVILDEAAQKGTGKWTSQSALDTGAAIPTINAAVEARLISALKAERVAASRLMGGTESFTGDQDALVTAAESALYASKITSYAQGFSLLKMASQDHDWKIDLSQVASIWRAGCIIRAALLNDIAAAYRHSPDLPNLLVGEAFTPVIIGRQAAWREVVTTAVNLGIPMPATSASLAYFDAYRSAVLPANLTQAQRDYFGAHTYRRLDREGAFHTQWETQAGR